VAKAERTDGSILTFKGLVVIGLPPNSHSMRMPEYRKKFNRFTAGLGMLLLIAVTTVVQGDDRKMPWDSMFSIGGDATTSRNVAMHKTWVPEMRAIGIDSMRTINVHWIRSQPSEEDPVDFPNMEAQAAYLKSQGMTFGGTLSGCPKWANGVGGLPVGAFDLWAGYVGAVVGRLKDDIHAWEIWNEPPNFTNKNENPKDYADTLITAYKAAKEADPDCLVGIAAKSAHINYLDRVIASGAKDHFDFLTLHPYELLGLVHKHPGTEPMFMSIAPTTRKMLARRNPAKQDVPIWFTELGADAERLGEDGQAASLVKAYTMAIEQGVASISWFEGRDGDSGPMGLMTKDKTKRMAYTAMAEMIRHYGQQPKAIGWLMLNDRHYAFAAEGKHGTILSAWTTTRTPDQVDFGKMCEIVDPLTGRTSRAETVELTLRPILVLNPPQAMIDAARANHGKPLLWGGDYSQAKSVSVTFGETIVEKGLHTQSAQSIAEDVVLYGGAGRAGDVPGGNVFMVDPAFLSYDTVPIEITFEVRRNPDNDPQRLVLEYESTTGYKKAAPFPIPDNQQWHTARFRIDDCQFVNTWGFSFRINQGTYAVRKVAVTRLDR